MAQNNENEQPNAYQVNDEDNVEEKDLRRTFLFGKGDEEEKGKANASEGFGSGGQSFGEVSKTPAGDDPNNPSQNAGYSNAYFSRTEPLEEHPENNNFKDANQLGQPNYAQAADAAKTGQSDDENTGPEKDSDEAEENKQDESFQEGTVDGDDVNIPGYNELPDQQKVGE